MCTLIKVIAVHVLWSSGRRSFERNSKARRLCSPASPSPDTPRREARHPRVRVHVARAHSNLKQGRTISAGSGTPTHATCTWRDTRTHATRTLHFMKTEKIKTVSGRTFNLHVLYRRGYVRTRPRPAPPNCRSSIVSIAAASPSSGSSSSAIRSSAAASCPRPRCARASTNDETNSLTDQPATLLYFTAHSPARGRAPVGGRRRRAPEAQAP